MKLFLASLLALSTSTLALELEGDFQGPLGLQLYSLRETFKTDPIGALDKAKAYGFTTAELYSGLPIEPEKLKGLLAERGIVAVSGHFAYDGLKKDLAGSVKMAQTLGLRYAGVAWIPHDVAEFGAADVQRTAADFESFGAAFKAAGIQFFYHTHGYEFRPVKEGEPETFFDLLVKATKPELVSFEMDVFWVTSPGQDPVKLLAKYPDRWVLMHLKDMRKGAQVGVYTGHAPLTDDVPLGTGMIDWPAVLKEGKRVGVKYYFIEDESPTVLEAIPVTLKYLRSLRF